MRRYDEPIEVRQGLLGEEEGPAQFVWRERLWVVRDVITRWMETGAWWEAPGARAARGEWVPEGVDLVRGADMLSEHEIWRVVAGRGPRQPLGIYELDHAWASGTWRLRVVVD